MAVKFTVDASEAERALRVLPDNLHNEVWLVIKQTADTVQRKARENLENRDKLASEETWRKIEVDYRRAQLTAITESKAEQTKYIQGGRRPGARPPPPDSILNWMGQKGISGDMNDAWRIAIGISKNGIKPYLFFDNAAQEAVRGLGDDLDGAIRRAMAESFR